MIEKILQNSFWVVWFMIQLAGCQTGIRNAHRYGTMGKQAKGHPTLPKKRWCKCSHCLGQLCTESFSQLGSRVRGAYDQLIDYLDHSPEFYQSTGGCSKFLDHVEAIQFYSQIFDEITIIRDDHSTFSMIGDINSASVQSILNWKAKVKLTKSMNTQIYTTLFKTAVKCTHKSALDNPYFKFSSCIDCVLKELEAIVFEDQKLIRDLAFWWAEYKFYTPSKYKLLNRFKSHEAKIQAKRCVLITRYQFLIKECKKRLRFQKIKPNEVGKSVISCSKEKQFLGIREQFLQNLLLLDNFKARMRTVDSQERISRSDLFQTFLQYIRWGISVHLFVLDIHTLIERGYPLQELRHNSWKKLLKFSKGYRKVLEESKHRFKPHAYAYIECAELIHKDYSVLESGKIETLLAYCEALRCIQSQMKLTPEKVLFGWYTLTMK